MLTATWLLLFPQLLSPYVIGVDAHWELVTAERTLLTGTWDPNVEGNTANGALSITILAPMISLISGVRIDIITKIVYSIFPILFIPIIWNLNRRVFHLSLKESFAALLLLIGTYSFMMISVLSRQEVALFLMLLIAYILIIKQKDISPVTILLIIGLTISHYSTAIVFTFLLMGSSLIMRYINTAYKKGYFTYALFCAFFVTTWVLYTVASTSQNAIESGRSILDNIFDLAIDNTSIVVQQQLKPSFGDLFSIMNYGINILILSLLSIGAIYAALKYIARDEKSDVTKSRYISMSFIAIAMVFSSILPGVSLAYNPERTYLTVLVLFNGLFIVGIWGVRDGISLLSRFVLKKEFLLPAKQKSSLVVIIAVSIVIMHLLLQVGFPSQLVFNKVDSKYFGDPCNDFHYTLVEEIDSIHWITLHKKNTELLFTDIYGRGFLPLQSYGLYNKEDVISIRSASQMHADDPGLYYQQKFDLTVKNDLYSTDLDKIQQINSLLSHYSKVLCCWDTDVYIINA